MFYFLRDECNDRRSFKTYLQQGQGISVWYLITILSNYLSNCWWTTKSNIFLSSTRSKSWDGVKRLGEYSAILLGRFFWLITENKSKFTSVLRAVHSKIIFALKIQLWNGPFFDRLKSKKANVNFGGRNQSQSDQTLIFTSICLLLDHFKKMKSWKIVTHFIFLKIMLSWLLKFI